MELVQNMRAHLDSKLFTQETGGSCDGFFQESSSASILSITGLGDLSHGRSHLSHLSFGLLHYIVHGDAVEHNFKGTNNPECNSTARCAYLIKTCDVSLG